MKRDIKDYKPTNGFYDLRDFELTNKEFIRAWRVQDFLIEVRNRQDEYKNGGQWQEIQEVSAQFQMTLLGREKKQLRLF